MKIAVCSDEPYPVHETILAEIKKHGHEVKSFGSFASHKEESWPCVAEEAAVAIAMGDCDEGIFLCWTGTGISMTANKISGIRAALCTDAETARGARIWNHANVLALSNRLLSQDLAKEILAAWFETNFSEKGHVGVAKLKEIDERFRKL